MSRAQHHAPTLSRNPLAMIVDHPPPAVGRRRRNRGPNGPAFVRNTSIAHGVVSSPGSFGVWGCSFGKGMIELAVEPAPNLFAPDRLPAPARRDALPPVRLPQAPQTTFKKLAALSLGPLSEISANCSAPEKFSTTCYEPCGRGV